MKKLICCWLLILTFAGIAAAQKNLNKEEARLFQTEIEFAKLSQIKGVSAAFSAYFAEDSILLPHNGNPVSGKDAIVKYLGDGFTLAWKPLRAEVAKSGDIGYTYGTAETRWIDKDGKPQVRYGKYMSVWRKQPDGAWKVIVDMGNDSPAPEPSKTAARFK